MRAGPSQPRGQERQRSGVLSVAIFGVAMMISGCSSALASAQGVMAKDRAAHAACITGFRAALVGSDLPSRMEAETLALLSAENSALLDVCGPDELALAAEAENDARWFVACRNEVSSKAFCERLQRERQLYRTND